jgi:site-specific recombinase XerD
VTKANTIVAKATADFLRHLRERNASPHTIKAYSGDLANFAAYAGSRGWKSIDHIAIRGFLSQLYEKGLGKTSVARSLAAVRSLYRWLAREGVVEQNPAKLVATPKLAKKLPRVPTIEEMNSVLDEQMPEAAAFPERDRLMLELLYGCGIRNSELTGINLDDIRLSAEAILIRGKGKKERYVPFGDSVKIALAAYLPARQAALAETRKNKTTAADHPQRGPHYQEDCGRQGAFARRASPHPAPRVRHAHAGRGRRPPRHSGITRPRAPGYDAALHAALDEACVAGLRPDASPRKVAETLAAARSSERSTITETFAVPPTSRQSAPSNPQ